MLCSPRITSQSTQPESVRASRAVVDAYDVNPLFIARERRRCEPGSNSVIVTASLTRCEGHVLRLGGVLRTRKIFVGCPAIRPIWDQSPGIRNPRLETVGNRLYPLHDQDCLRRFTAEAQIQDRSRDKTGPNTAPGFLRVYNIPSPSMGEGQGEGDTADPPSSFPRRREPREKQSTPPIHSIIPSPSTGEGQNRGKKGGAAILSIPSIPPIPVQTTPHARTTSPADAETPGPSSPDQNQGPATCRHTAPTGPAKPLRSRS